MSTLAPQLRRAEDKTAEAKKLELLAPKQEEGTAQEGSQKEELEDWEWGTKILVFCFYLSHKL